MRAKNLLPMTILLAFAFLAHPAWSQSSVKAGCEPIAEAYLKQAIRLSAEASKLSDWLAKSDYAAMCSFYTVEYPGAQIAYIQKIEKLKQKNVCWTKDDQESLGKNQMALIEGAALRKENCEKAGIVPGNDRKTSKNECVIKSELVDSINRIINKTDANAQKNGRAPWSEESKQSSREEIYRLAEIARLIVDKAEDCPAGRMLWHPPQKLK